MSPLPVALLLAAMLAQPVVAAEMRLEVDLSSSKLTAHIADKTREYNVGVGSKKYPTPQGRFTIRKVIWNPGWVPPDEKWARKKTPMPPGHPDNPMKRVKMFFKEPDYFIHGSDDPSTSHGCIRMSPGEASALAQLLMEHGGQPRSLPWYRRVFKRRSTRVVLLSKPIAIEIHQ